MYLNKVYDFHASNCILVEMVYPISSISKYVKIESQIYITTDSHSYSRIIRPPSEIYDQLVFILKGNYPKIL